MGKAIVCVSLLAIVIVAGVAVIVGEEEKPILTGTWQGRFDDVHGFSGSLIFFVDSVSDGGRIEGTFEMKYPVEGRSIEIEGKLTGTLKDGKVELRFDWKWHETATYILTGTLEEATPYALHAWYGTYDVVQHPKQFYMGGGVWIVWRFRE